MSRSASDAAYRAYGDADVRDAHPEARVYEHVVRIKSSKRSFHDHADQFAANIAELLHAHGVKRVERSCVGHRVHEVRWLNDGSCIATALAAMVRLAVEQAERVSLAPTESSFHPVDEAEVA